VSGGWLMCRRSAALAEMQRFGQPYEIAHLAEVNHRDTEPVLIAS
jgi:hypothetical protein